MSEYDPQDQMMQRLNATKPVNQRDPFLPAGEHESLIVVSVETYNDKKWGRSVRATFEAEKSTSMPPGSRGVRIWNIFKPSEWETQDTDADAFVDFVCQMLGCALGSEEQKKNCFALLKARAEGGRQEDQLARGVRISASCRPAKAGTNPKTNKPYSFTPISWRTYTQQDGGLVAQTRAKLDAKQPYVPRQQAAAQPNNWQQVAAAPHPAQMQQQAQYTQPYGVPAQQVATQVQVQPQPTSQMAPAGGFLSLIK